MNIMFSGILLLLMLFTAGGCEKSSKVGDVSAPDLKIGRMKVSIWPEYDTEGVLVVYEGKFYDRERFPAKAAFVLPKGVRDLTDACSLSPKGEHFCQLYEVSQRGGRSEVLLKLPYPDFFIDFQYNPLSGSEKREFKYAVSSKYPIELLEVNIQQPLRSSEFNITPASSKESEDKGFRYLHYTYEGLPQGKEIQFNISYKKQDARPSVDIKSASMANSGTSGSNRGYMIFLAGGILLLILLGYYRYSVNRKKE
ncbi:MAG: hypothetical protein HZC13_00110 [Nitrospirae bacterium]|nr:hypothetical protein [Nitrospirota bacterium]